MKCKIQVWGMDFIKQPRHKLGNSLTTFHLCPLILHNSCFVPGSSKLSCSSTQVSWITLKTHSTCPYKHAKCAQCYPWMHLNLAQGEIKSWSASKGWNVCNKKKNEILFRSTLSGVVIPYMVHYICWTNNFIQKKKLEADWERFSGRPSAHSKQV